MGRIVADRVPARAPAAPTKTKAQIEAEERARAAAASRAAAARAEAARQTKAQVERAERAQEAARQSRSNQPRRPDDWNTTIQNSRNTTATNNNKSSGSPAPTPAPAPATAPSPPPKKVPPTPPTPVPVPDPPVFRAVKSAPIDTVSFVDESFSSEFITDILFEDIGGLELLAITRSDTVNGQQVIYQPIKNLNILQDTYNPNNLLRLQETSDRFFANFMIKLNEKIPKVGNGQDGANYYLDLVSGDGVIELINLKPDEQVELQIANAGTIEDVGI